LEQNPTRLKLITLHPTTTEAKTKYMVEIKIPLEVMGITHHTVIVEPIEDKVEDEADTTLEPEIPGNQVFTTELIPIKI
jgi:hypothetical protein